MLWNNHGWGLREMLFLCAILLFFVLIVAVLVSQLYGNLERNTRDNEKNSSYAHVETLLKNAARKYVKKTNDTSSIILSDDLISEYISLEDLTVNNDICEGYVVYENNTYTPYISCAHYETEGY